MLPLFVLLIAQFIGLLTIVVQKSINKSKVYHNSRVIVAISFAVITFITLFLNWKHEKNFGNIESNEDYFKYFASESEHQEKIAFDSLSNKFNNPNAFKIVGSFNDNKDTNFNGETKTIYFLTLLYQKANDKENFKANFRVLNDTATILYYDQLLDKKDYDKIDTFNMQVKRNFRDAIKQVTDSLRQELKKEFPALK